MPEAVLGEPRDRGPTDWSPEGWRLQHGSPTRAAAAPPASARGFSRALSRNSCWSSFSLISRLLSARSLRAVRKPFDFGGDGGAESGDLDGEREIFDVVVVEAREHGLARGA